MTKLKRLALLLLVVPAGCGGAAIPQQSLTAAQASVKGAEVGGAAESPKAQLHLKLAKEQLAEAQKRIDDDENEEAARLIDRAQADADLALALSRQARARNEADVAIEQLEELKKRVKR